MDFVARSQGKLEAALGHRNINIKKQKHGAQLTVKFHDISFKSSYSCLRLFGSLLYVGLGWETQLVCLSTHRGPIVHWRRARIAVNTRDVVKKCCLDGNWQAISKDFAVARFKCFQVDPNDQFTVAKHLAAMVVRYYNY